MPPESVTPDELERVLPGLVDALRGYHFRAEDHARASRALHSLLDGGG